MILLPQQLFAITTIVVGVCALATAVGPPEREVERNVLISEREPKVRIELPKKVQYVGADRWLLLDMADCELHAFVEAERGQSVEKLYWVQFEGYLPTKPKLKHQYDSPRHTTIGGLDFYVDTWIRTSDEKVTPDSDLEHLEALIRVKGFKLPAGMMCVRLVHLLDEQKRKELMIIYGEDLASTGLAAADLKKGGEAHDEWKSLEKGLVERAESKIVITQTSEP